MAYEFQPTIERINQLTSSSQARGTPLIVTEALRLGYILGTVDTASTIAAVVSLPDPEAEVEFRKIMDDVHTLVESVDKECTVPQ